MKFVILYILILGFIVCQANSATIFWEAEKFTAKNGDNIKLLNVPYNALGTPDQNVANYVISEASGNMFMGVPNDFPGLAGSWLKYELNIPSAGNWYLWGKFIAPSVADNSVFWGIDIADADAVSADNDKVDIWDFYEAEPLRVNYTTKWVWFRVNSRNGAPFFPGRELDQYTDNPTPLSLSAGKHVLYIIEREAGVYFDSFLITTDKAFDPNKDVISPVNSKGKITSTWGNIKQSH